MAKMFLVSKAWYPDDVLTDARYWVLPIDEYDADCWLCVIDRVAHIAHDPELLKVAESVFGVELFVGSYWLAADVGSPLREESNEVRLDVEEIFLLPGEPIEYGLRPSKSTFNTGTVVVSDGDVIFKACIDGSDTPNMINSSRVFADAFQQVLQGEFDKIKGGKE